MGLLHGGSLIKIIGQGFTPAAPRVFFGRECEATLIHASSHNLLIVETPEISEAGSREIILMFGKNEEIHTGVFFTFVSPDDKESIEKLVNEVLQKPTSVKPECTLALESVSWKQELASLDVNEETSTNKRERGSNKSLKSKRLKV